MNSVLITGGNGFVGSQIARHLRDSGWNVYTLSRNEPQEEFFSDKWIQCDLTVATDVKSALSGKGFSAVIHAAGRTVGTASEFSESNVDGTRNLLEAMKPSPPGHFVFLSTFHVYDAGDTITEESNCAPQSPYGVSKLAAEKLVIDFSEKMGTGHSILRLSNSYGCPQSLNGNGWQLVISDLARTAFVNHRVEIRSPKETARDFISLKDVVSVIQKILDLESPPNDCFNVGFEKSFRIDEIVEIINQAHFERFCFCPTVEYESSKKTNRPPFQFSTARLKQRIPFSPKDRIKETVFEIFDLLDE